ncbi:hypothetical protein [Tolypothrix sp. VBCCA 56010]|uniref:hypothetical protein n=1 Tax=Tolypothrix sp. VBCCA 56010 TaxID=3137731 RepID=UPI003D7DF682
MEAVKELISWGLLYKEERFVDRAEASDCNVSNLYILTPPEKWRRSPLEISTLIRKPGNKPKQKKNAQNADTQRVVGDSGRSTGSVPPTPPQKVIEINPGGVPPTPGGVPPKPGGVPPTLIELDSENYNQLTRSTHKSEEKFCVREPEDVVNSFPEEEVASDSKLEQVEYHSSDVVNQKKVTQPTQDPKVDQVSAKFVYSEETNYSFVEDIEKLPRGINGRRLVPWEKQGASRNNRYDQPFATWMYENHLKKYTGFTSKGYEENLLAIRGYLGKVHTDSTRMERVVDFWNDYVKLVSVPQEEPLPDTPLQSFLTSCGSKLRGILLRNDFTPEQLESIAKLWEACRRREELTILCLEEEKLIKL